MIEETDTSNVYKISIVILIFLVILSGFGGYYLGTLKHEGIINNLFPALPDEIYYVAGIIREFEGNSIILEITSLEKRYLPGEEVKLVKLTIETNENTIMIKQVLEEFGDVEKYVEPKEIIIGLEELNLEDFIIAESEENIKSKSKFTASKITLR